MPDAGYLVAALGAAVAVTVALRALPFVFRRAIGESALLADVGRWMPLGAVAILAIYCLAQIDVTAPAPELAGVAVTVVVHLWRRNAVLSIMAGTAVCLLLTNLG